MQVLDFLALGFIQGLTEFIPISSSGHLILAREIFGFSNTNGLMVDAVLQLATTLAIAVYFAKDIKVLLRDRVLVKAVIVGTIPAVVLGILLEDIMATLFRDPHLVIWTLLAGALLMYFAERAFRGSEELSVGKGFKIGLFQALALFPGFSRSGATISGGLLMGLTREAATRFSFILALPVLLGSGIKGLYDLRSVEFVNVLGTPLVLGVVTAFVVGISAIHFLLQFLKTHKLNIFVWYRVVLALLLLFFL